jgi:hypothetical protein
MLLMYLPLVIYAASMQMFLDGLQRPNAIRVGKGDRRSPERALVSGGASGEHNLNDRRVRVRMPLGKIPEDFPVEENGPGTNTAPVSSP